ncbi:MAG: hypothetical protein AAF848_05365, partial [Pseudomonadota bacterium]
MLNSTSIALATMTGIVAVTLVGDYLLKVASLKNGLASFAFVGGAAMYMASAVGILFAMRQMSLASVGVYYSVLTILAMTALGVLVFGEQLLPREVLGIGFAIASLVCMA